MRFALAAVCAALTGCGYVGDPMPPSLDIPQPVTDLRALAYGDRVLVEFTLPAQTTESLALKSVRSMDLYVGPAGAAPAEEWAATARRYPVADPKPGPIRHEFPVRDWTGREVEMRVRATGPKGRASAWSNLVVLQIVEPPAVPTGIRAQTVADGVQLDWQGAGPRFRILRSTGDGDLIALGDSETPTFLDRTAIFGMSYRYRIQALASELQLGALADPVAITPEDRFPPLAPADLTGLAAAQSIELAWSRSGEEDFASYNVYRATGGGTFERIAAMLEAPTFSDSRVLSGSRYRYAVTAVDVKGNESPRSEPVEIVAQ